MTLLAEFTSPQQTLAAYVGANEVSGLQTSATFNPDLPAEYFPSEPERPDGQDGNDELAPALEDARRLPNGNFPCAHQCQNRSLCNHICCKEGVKRGGKPGFSAQQPSSIRTAIESELCIEDQRLIAVAAEQDEKIRTSKKRRAPELSQCTHPPADDELDVAMTVKPALSGVKSKHFTHITDVQDQFAGKTVEKSQGTSADIAKERAKNQVEDVDDEEWDAIVREKQYLKLSKKRSRDEPVNASTPKFKRKKRSLREELELGLDDELDEADGKDEIDEPTKPKIKGSSSSSEVDPMKHIRALEKSGMFSAHEIAVMRAKLETDTMANDISQDQQDKKKTRHTNLDQELGKSQSNVSIDPIFQPSFIQPVSIKSVGESGVEGPQKGSDDWLADLDGDDTLAASTSTQSAHYAQSGRDRKPIKIMDDFEMLFGGDDSIVVEDDS